MTPRFPLLLASPVSKGAVATAGWCLPFPVLGAQCAEVVLDAEKKGRVCSLDPTRDSCRRLISALSLSALVAPPPSAAAGRVQSLAAYTVGNLARGQTEAARPNQTGAARADSGLPHPDLARHAVTFCCSRLAPASRDQGGLNLRLD